MEENKEEITVKKSLLNKTNKKLLIAVVIVVVVLIIGAGLLYFLIGGSSSSSDETSGSEYSLDSDLPELKPEDIGMEVSVREDGRAIMFELTKADDIKYVEYIIEYEAESDEGGIINQGIFGEMNIGEDGITKTDFREFGSCSAGKCKYDVVVSDATINLTRVEKEDGSVYRVTKIVKLDN